MEPTALARLLAQIAAILLVSRGLGLILRRLGQPMVIAEMLAGIALGPSLLGALWPGAFSAVFPAASLGGLKLLADLGLVLFMFMVGLELDPTLLRGRGRGAAVISQVGIVLPFVLGVGCAWWLHEDYAPRGIRFLTFAMFFGTALSITAFPVLVRILTERGLLHSPIGTLAVACAAVDDVCAWCLLAFLVAMARAGGVQAALSTTGMAVAFVLFMLLVARPLLARLGKFMVRHGELGPTRVVALLVLMFGTACVAEAIGIHALFGAFLFGAVLPREPGLGLHSLSGKLESVVGVLLLPLFFAYSGLRTNLGLVGVGGHALVALVVIALATLGKLGGVGLAAYLTGSSFRDARALGILMNTRGLMELVVLNVGMDLGVITPTIFAILVLMACVTTLATTPLLRWCYAERPGAVHPAVINSH